MSALRTAQRLTLADNPPQWPALPEPVQRALVAGGGTVWHHRDCVAVWRGPKLTHDCVRDCPVRLMHEVLAKRWFLIRNDNIFGHYPDCERCNGVHTYVTAGCIERPFNGKTEIMGLLEQDRAGGFDGVVRGFRLGNLVPIKAIEAFVLREKIRAKGYPA
jgi:hypothetical protein